jgi:hypothetical protein
MRIPSYIRFWQSPAPHVRNSAPAFGKTTGCAYPRLLAILLACALALLQPSALMAEPVAVRHLEGVVHGFLSLRTMDGKTIADGELSQVADGDRVTDRLTFRFKDGSFYQDTTVFSQRGKFRLLSDHLVTRGSAFKQPMESSIDTSKGQVTVRYKDDAGKEKVLNQKVEMPADVSNGLMLTLMKHIYPSAARTTVSLLATTPKPRLVKMAISPLGQEPFAIGNTKYKAMHYVVKVKIGGIAGLLAPLLGQQPPDTHVWVLGGEAPAFVKSEGPLYAGGPIWRIELASPGFS